MYGQTQKSTGNDGTYSGQPSCQVVRVAKLKSDLILNLILYVESAAQ